MSDPRKLARHVTVAGTTYGPGDTVPEDVAKRITNPKAWLPLEQGDGDDTADSEGRPAGTAGGHRLAKTVSIGGTSYGPRDHIPDDVARRITNPKAWAGGNIPTFHAETGTQPDAGADTHSDGQ